MLWAGFLFLDQGEEEGIVVLIDRGKITHTTLIIIIIIAIIKVNNKSDVRWYKM